MFGKHKESIMKQQQLDWKFMLLCVVAYSILFFPSKCKSTTHPTEEDADDDVDDDEKEKKRRRQRNEQKFDGRLSETLSCQRATGGTACLMYACVCVCVEENDEERCVRKNFSFHISEY